MAIKTREAQLVETFVTLADTLVVGYDMVDMLHTLLENCTALFGATAGGILLADEGGELEVIASTDERSLLVELLQLRLDGGPCLECYVTGHAVTVNDLREQTDTWPQFRSGALEQGFISLHAAPLRLRADIIGSLNLFWGESGGPDERDARIIQALADVATISILQERAVRESDLAREQLQHALNSRITIEQAKGVVAYQREVDMNQAFTLIRDYARSHRLPLLQVAADVVDRSLVL
jgi:transcriptional regulator with GAF, ATPase, and Fis domain